MSNYVILYRILPDMNIESIFLLEKIKIMLYANDRVVRLAEKWEYPWGVQQFSKPTAWAAIWLPRRFLIYSDLVSE